MLCCGSEDSALKVNIGDLEANIGMNEEISIGIDEVLEEKIMEEKCK